MCVCKRERERERERERGPTGVKPPVILHVDGAPVLS